MLCICGDQPVKTKMRQVIQPARSTITRTYQNLLEGSHNKKKHMIACLEWLEHFLVLGWKPYQLGTWVPFHPAQK